MNRVLQILVFLCLLHTITRGLSQGITSNWIMGYGQNIVDRSLLNFGSGSLATSQFTYPMQYKYTNTTISDNNGSLLFSVNGYYIADASGDTMQNGSGLNPSFYTTMFPDGLSIPQANLVLLKPDSDSIYYLFHSTVDIQATSQTQYLYLTTIDLKGNSGLGSVIAKNQVLISDIINVGKLTACKHANGRDWWVFCHKWNTNTFYYFLVTPSAINGPYMQSVGIVRPDDAGQIVFSPDGTKFAYYWPIHDLEIFDFDRCTGILSNPEFITFNDSASTGGVAFSPNSEVLYVSSTKYVYQFDVTAANISATQQTVAVWDGFYSPFPPFATLFALSQLAPDGKIYISTGNSGNHLHVINQPDSLGTACDLVQHGIQIPHLYFNTLPNHPNYFLGKIPGSPCDTITNTGLDPPFPEGGVGFFPNPSNGVFTLSFPVQSVAGDVEVYDVDGRMVYKEYVAAWSQFKRMELSFLRNGIYFCKMRWGDKVKTTKIIIE